VGGGFVAVADNAVGVGGTVVGVAVGGEFVGRAGSAVDVGGAVVGVGVDDGVDAQAATTTVTRTSTVI
jgi:hypothetical protein